MQIKHFEADDMTEALRVVKREFGDDAVILSAKEIRPKGFFSALRKTSVEITAATDYSTPNSVDRHGFSEALSNQLEVDSQCDRVSLSSLPASVSPTVRENVRRVPTQTSTSVDPSTDLKGWIGCLEKNRRTAEPFYKDRCKRKVIALVGPSGVGKSTTVAKLARHCRAIENLSIGLISLDRFRLGANAIIRRVAGILDLPLTIVHDTGQLTAALDRPAGADVVLIDTPGIDCTDRAMMDYVSECLQSACPDETHLVANATVRQEVLAAGVEIFSALDINRLLLTHVDELITAGADFRSLQRIRLAASFYADGVDLFDCLHETVVAQKNERAHFKSNAAVEPVTALSRKRSAVAVISDADTPPGDSIQFVANTNSELFHQPACRSVKRINQAHIVAFDSAEQAMEEGFKPCRACCDVSLLNSPARKNGGHLHMRAI